ncbi:TetR/AcrR family transcriptional regulator C-terminal domain-containing protein [Pseudonocardia benzenivorans]|uniref:TetR/AcrR family transcriptional regulator C-terminal domain-containing protein n=1 Tax=Pseudonocardia benzenivorans TaxID=228005 RepID=A0ABW3VSE1_9PSEU|nr:TetR family transcriptional regulator [Pseudonocardia sp. D17]
MDDGSPTVWERAEPPPRTAPTPLSRAAIVAAAIALADEGGLDAVSLRKVGAALSAGPMRLYGFVDSKDELLDLMADAVQGEIGVPAGEWRVALTALAEATRAAVLRHEWFADLMGGRPRLGPNRLAVLEGSLAAVLPAFPAVDDARHVLWTVHAYVAGAVRAEVGERRAARRTGVDKPAWEAAHGSYLRRTLATGRFPMIERFVAEGTDGDPAAVFAAGLTAVLDGLAAQRR